jgi:hypothetical protein
MFIMLGVIYIAYEGTSALSGLYEENGIEDLSFAAEEWVSTAVSSVPNVLVLAVLVAATLTAVAVAVLRRRWRNSRRRLTGADEGSEEFAQEQQSDRVDAQSGGTHL